MKDHVNEYCSVAFGTIYMKALFIIAIILMRMLRGKVIEMLVKRALKKGNLIPVNGSSEKYQDQDRILQTIKRRLC